MHYFSRLIFIALTKSTIAFISLLFFISLASSQNKVLTAPSPEWITQVEPDPNLTIDEDEIVEGSIFLLSDNQVHVPKEESYTRLVTKITENTGVQSASRITAIYDPEYQKLIFHHIKIIRDGKVIDKLNADHFQVMRRELNAENYLYDGSLSATLDLSDVRRGDIIDYSYSLKGFNPLNNEDFAGSYYLGDFAPTGTVNVVVNSREKLFYKNIKTEIKPVLTNNNGIYKYQWLVENPEVAVYEQNVPYWEYELPMVVLSTVAEWKEVVDWALPLYKDKFVSFPAIKEQTELIKSQHANEAGQIKAALDFVQNDIRYLGLEYGISGYKPNSPKKVFDQRFGDCKDKSLLLVNMLNELGIQAYPVLVNTMLKHTITELPASHVFFDHCIVKVVDSQDNVMFYDPTAMNQGGTYSNVHLPDYRYGLVIKEGVTELEEIHSKSQNRVSSVEEFTVHEIGGSADLKVVTTYTDGEADNIRNTFKNSSLSKISKEYESFYANHYNKITATQKPEIEDDLDKNQIVVREYYKIDSLWVPYEDKKGYISMSFTPTNLADILYADYLQERKASYYLPHPASREHEFIVNLPEPWTIINEENEISNDYFYYDYSIKYNNFKKQLRLKYYFKNQKSAVNAEDILSYANQLDKINQSFGYTLYIPEDGNLDLETISSGFGEKAAYVVLTGAGILVLILIIVARNNRKRNQEFY